jgi:hypothetical protein
VNLLLSALRLLLFLLSSMFGKRNTSRWAVRESKALVKVKHNSRNMGRAILLSFLDRHRVMIVCFHYRLQAAVLCLFSDGGKSEE